MSGEAKGGVQPLRFQMATTLAVLALMMVGIAAGCDGGEEEVDSTSPSTESATAEPHQNLVLDGLVESPLNLTLDDLSAMPKTTEYLELYCVDYPTVPVEKGDWTGVRLGLLLEQAVVSPEAVKIAFYADDGYSTDLTIPTAMREDIILAYERDGMPLSEGLRLVVPGKWGYKWISELTHIELVDYDFTGVWESRGYSDEADIPADSPGAE
jgi:DMSO/TMAO reductase YedYZ molybdopterin-dependent catalytic subunit